MPYPKPPRAPPYYEAMARTTGAIRAAKLAAQRQQKPLAKRKQRREIAVAKEERTQAALRAIAEGVSINEAAKLFDVCKSTLLNRFHGKRKPIAQAKEYLQRLSPSKESSLVNAVYQFNA